MVPLVFKYIIISEQHNCLIPQSTSSKKLRREEEKRKKSKIDILDGYYVGVGRMGPDSFQWCPVTGQGATGTN